MDLRYFEIHDLLCDVLIALEAGDTQAAAGRLRKALAWTEAEWLATPSALPRAGPTTALPDDHTDDDD